MRWSMQLQSPAAVADGRVIALVAQETGADLPLWLSTVCIMPGVDPEDWIAIARDRLIPADSRLVERKS